MKVLSSDLHDDDDDEKRPLTAALFGRRRSMHSLLGGGKVADALLWKNARFTTVIVIGMTALWFIFEVAEFSLVTLLCHFSIATLLLAFIWCHGRQFFYGNPPDFPKSIFDESIFQKLASAIFFMLNEALSDLLHIARGEDAFLFVLSIVCMYMLSVIGNYVSLMNFIYFGFIFLQTLPFLLNHYDVEIHYYAVELATSVKKMFPRLHSEILSKCKIPTHCKENAKESGHK